MGSPSATIEADHRQRARTGQLVSGDVFLSRRLKDEDRVVAVLSDGLGSGVKASVLATLTATMALEYAARLVDARKSAGIIMDTLPVCSVRGISYSTFTIVDAAADGRTRVIEHGNPPFVLLRQGRPRPVEASVITLERWQDRPIRYSEFTAELGDRILFFSDGVSQAGMGERGTPFGWGRERVEEFAARLLERQPELDAGAMAQRILDEAGEMDGGQARDDTSCAVVHRRLPRRLLVVTGPPFARDRDRELGELLAGWSGRCVIAGGTTAGIVARELGREVEMDLGGPLDPEIPPASTMEGVDLVTEGTLTLGRVAQALEEGATPESLRDNAVKRLIALILESDIVRFVVGTRINEAHQDPNIPVELDLRRNVVRRIAAALEARHLKQVEVSYL